MSKVLSVSGFIPPRFTNHHNGISRLSTTRTCHSPYCQTNTCALRTSASLKAQRLLLFGGLLRTGVGILMRILEVARLRWSAASCCKHPASKDVHFSRSPSHRACRKMGKSSPWPASCTHRQRRQRFSDGGSGALGTACTQVSRSRLEEVSTGVPEDMKPSLYFHPKLVSSQAHINHRIHAALLNGRTSVLYKSARKTQSRVRYLCRSIDQNINVRKRDKERKANAMRTTSCTASEHCHACTF